MKYWEVIKCNVQNLIQNPQTNIVPYCDHRYNSSTSSSCLIVPLHSQASKNLSKVALNVCHFSVLGNISAKQFYWITLPAFG